MYLVTAASMAPLTAAKNWHRCHHLLLELHRELDAWIEIALACPSRATSAWIFPCLPCWLMRDWEACW